MGAQPHAGNDIALSAEFTVTADFKGHCAIGGGPYFFGEQSGKLMILVIIGGGVHMSNLDGHRGETCFLPPAFAGNRGIRHRRGR